LILSSFVFVGCGASKVEFEDNSRDQSSRVDPTDKDNIDHGLLTECSGFNNPSMGVSSYTSTFYDPRSGSYVPDYIRMNITTLPNDLLYAEQHIIMFRLGESQTGALFTNEDPVEFYVQQRGTGAYLNVDPLTKISKNTIESLINSNNLGAQGTTVANFFDRHILVLVGMDLEYDALVVALYDPRTGSNSATHSEITLLPAFSADPNVYGQNHSSRTLIEAHPLYSRRNSGLSEQQFLEQMNYYCTF
jgi:hypothetical protein